MHSSPKPVRKCHACKLNLGERCAVFPIPHEQWKHGTCKGWNNEALYQKYLDDEAKHPPDAHKAKRREVAKLAHTESHHDGTKARATPVAPKRPPVKLPHTKPRRSAAKAPPRPPAPSPRAR
jgi:hypothetical protein